MTGQARAEGRIKPKGGNHGSPVSTRTFRGLAAGLAAAASFGAAACEGIQTVNGVAFSMCRHGRDDQISMVAENKTEAAILAQAGRCEFRFGDGSVAVDRIGWTHVIQPGRRYTHWLPYPQARGRSYTFRCEGINAVLALP